MRGEGIPGEGPGRGGLNRDGSVWGGAARGVRMHVSSKVDAGCRMTRMQGPVVSEAAAA